MGKKRKQRKSNENIFKFNILNFLETDYYLFIVTRYKSIINGIDNLNDIKLNENEINILQKKIDECISINTKNQRKLSIKILPQFFDFFNRIKKYDLKNSEYGKKITYIIDYLKKKNITITLKQISKQYENLYQKKISISTIARILKNHLGIRYLKTSLKNPKIEENNYLLMAFIFIRIFLKSLSLNLNIIFLDETGFLLENNNYFTWRQNNETISKGPINKLKERLNLILAVSNQKIIRKAFYKNSIDTKFFIEFLKGIINPMTEEEIRKTIIIMDNATFHISNEVIQFFKNQKLKGLTICPYRSSFNMSELVFRYVKNIIYKNVYNKMEELKEDVINILNSENLQKSLVNLYKETLQQYLIFIQNHNATDLSKIFEEN